MSQTPLNFPVGTEFWDVDGIPIATLPSEPPKRYNVYPPQYCDLQNLYENGIRIDKDDFCDLLERK